MLGLRFIGAPRIFNSVVLYQLRPVLGKNADLGSIDIRLGGIVLKDLQYNNQETGVAVQIKAARINWNLFNSIIYGLKPLLMIDEILIDDWKVQYAHSPDSISSSSNLLESIPWDLKQKIPSIKKISFKDGMVETGYLSAGRINCWLDLNDPDTLFFDFSAAALSDSANLRLSGVVKTDQKSISASIELHGANLRLLKSPRKEFSFHQGSVNLQSTISVLDTVMDLAGKVILQGVDFEYGDLVELKETGLELVLFPDSLKISGQGFLDRWPLVISGSIDGYTNPNLSLSFDLKELDFSKLIERLGIGADVSGTGRVSGAVTGTPSSPVFDIQLTAPTVKYQGIEIDKIRLSATYHQDRIGIKSLDGEIFGGKLHGTGTVDALNLKPQANLALNYSGKPDLDEISEQLASIPINYIELSARVKGPFDKPEIYASYTLTPALEIDDLKGDLQFKNRHLKIGESSGSGETLNLEIRFGESNPLFSLSGQNIQKLFPEDLLPDFIADDDFRVDVFAGGRENKFDVFLGFRRSDFTVNFNTEVERADSILIVGDYTVYLQDSIEAGGEIELSFADSMLLIENLTAGADLYVTGSIDIKNRNISNLSLKADEWGVDTLLLYLGVDNWEQYQGLLKLEVDVEGSFIEPDIEYSAYVSNGKIFGIEGYWTSMAGEFKENQLKLMGLDFGNRGSLLFSGRGQYDVKIDEIDFRASLDEVDFGLLFDSFFQNKGKFNGAGNYSIQAAGSLHDPLVQAGFRVETGRLFGVEFDHFTGGFKFDGSAGDKGTVEIPAAKMSKNGKYDITASGVVPLNGEKMNLNLNAAGNLLAVLSGLTGTIYDAASEGKVDIAVRGTINNPAIEKADISLKNGSMKLTSVVNKIEKINLEAGLDHDFIKIGNLSGVIDGVQFTLHNTRQVMTVEGPLEPWIIGSTGLNLGIMTLETGKEGLKLSIPGIVADGETANLSAVGLLPGELPYIAGPEEHPVIRAKLIVRDGVIDYPRPKKTRDPRKKKSIVSRFLEKVDWDLEIIPDRGNSYVRDMSGLAGGQIVKDISGLFSRMDADLEVERRLEGLKLDGSVRGDTSFSITGGFISTRGTVNVLDLDFQVQEFKIEFDAAENIPWVEGYATNVERNADGVEQTITIRAANIDPVTGEKVYRAKWGDFTFILENDAGDSQEMILGVLGYSPETLTEKAASVPLKAVDNAVFGQWLGRLERELKQVFGVDYINIDPALAQNLLTDQLTDPAAADSSAIDWRTRYLRHSKFTVGKYLTDDLFFTYSGTFESGESVLDQRERIGMIHTWNLEFRLPATSADLLMIMGYEYDNLDAKTDKRVSIRYTFNF